MYLTQKDRLTIQNVERAIYNEFGVDKDTYMGTRSMKSRIVLPRCVYIHEVYTRTGLTVTDLSESMGRHHSSIVRAVARVRRWMDNPRSKKHLERLKRIQNEIEQRTMG